MNSNLKIHGEIMYGLGPRSRVPREKVDQDFLRKTAPQFYMPINGIVTPRRHKSSSKDKSEIKDKCTTSFHDDVASGSFR